MEKKKKVNITLEYTIREPSDEDLCAGYPENIKVTVDGKQVEQLDTRYASGGAIRMWDVHSVPKPSDAWGFALEYGEV